MLQIAGNCALRQKHKDKQIRTQLAKTRTKESTAFRFGSSQVPLLPFAVSAVLHSVFEITAFSIQGRIGLSVCYRLP